MARDNCLLCQIVDGNIPSHKIYEDDSAVAVLDVNGASPGHTFIIPKEHYPIIEQVPDDVLASLFNLANGVSTAIFDSLSVQGTNLFVANGVPAGQSVAHFMIHVIPRVKNDGIGLLWEPKKLSEEEMSTIELKIKEFSSSIAPSKPEAKQQFKVPEAKAPTFSGSIDEDQIIRHLRRIP